MLTRYLFALICVCAFVISACDSKAPAQSSPLPAASGDTASETAPVESVPVVQTLAADVQGSDDDSARGTIVLVSDADALIVGSALDGLTAGAHAMSFGAQGACQELLGQPMPLPVFAQFTSSVHGQGKFSKTLDDAGALSALLGQSVSVSRVDSQDEGVVIACGELRAIVR